MFLYILCFCLTYLFWVMLNCLKYIFNGGIMFEFILIDFAMIPTLIIDEDGVWEVNDIPEKTSL